MKDDHDAFAKLCETYRRETSQLIKDREKADIRDELVMWSIVILLFVLLIAITM